MKYYVVSVEQTHADEKLVEYAGAKQYETEKTALSAFYDKLATVNKDMSETAHTFMDIKIMNSEGGITKRDTIGAYVEEV